MKTKFLAIPVIQTEDMYGYSAVLFSLDETNINLFKALKETFLKLKQIDPKLGRATHYFTNINIVIANSELDELIDMNEPSVIELDAEELAKFTNAVANTYKVENPNLTFNESGATFRYFSKYTSDTASCDLAYDQLTEIILTNIGILGITFLDIEIKFDCPVDRNLYDLGSVSLQCDGREFTLDVVQSSMNDEEDTIFCKIEVDLETFPINEYKYDLTAVDLIMNKTTGTLYIGEEYEETPDSITLFVKSNFTNDGNGMTKAIKLEID